MEFHAQLSWAWKMFYKHGAWSLSVYCTSLLKTLWEKEKLLVTSNFSFSHSVFYPFEELSTIFIKFEIVVCKFFQFGSVWNLSFGKGVKRLFLKNGSTFLIKQARLHRHELNAKLHNKYTETSGYNTKVFFVFCRAHFLWLSHNGTSVYVSACVRPDVHPDLSAPWLLYLWVDFKSIWHNCSP